MISKKFRGCLVGASIGDCLGYPFEGDHTISKSQLQKYFDKLENSNTDKQLKYSYTDDTSMTKSVAESLIEHKGFNASDMASKFVLGYDARRGYGHNVVQIFQKWNVQNLSDVWKPAREQFHGSGSYGNGGGMRIAPVALFYNRNYAKMMEIGKKVTELTHTHPLGVTGALLQLMNVHESLLLNNEQPINISNFVNSILAKIEPIEADNQRILPENASFKKQVQMVNKLLSADSDVPTEHVVERLGNSVSALHSIPTALYCFLRAQSPVGFIETENPFRRTIQLAISLGGDTDTIASMAGAIAGAYYGIDYIDKNIMNVCEGIEVIDNLAEKLYNSVSQ